ncbi:hypothetical protein HA402_009421 [Bradysia odoriphaga]|nr:hypothetical protein HA402_009421 [Bradysia odoriphaga]
MGHCVEVAEQLNKCRSAYSKKNGGIEEIRTIDVIIASLVASLSVMSPGIGLGYPAITTEYLSSPDAEVVLNASEISWFASITAISSPIGSLLAGYLSDKIGRRNTLLFITLISTISWIIIGFSSRDDAAILFIELMIGRSLIGIAIGMVTTPAVMYCSEICHAKIRARMTVMSTPFFMSFGSLVAYFLGYLFPNDFRLVSLIAAGITVVTMLSLFFIPESPVYLVTKNKIDDARKTLAKFRNLHGGDVRIDSEIHRIEESKNVSTDSFFSKWKEFGKPQLYQPFIIMLIFFAVQQLNGIFVILVYSARFSVEAGVEMDAFLSAVCIGIIRCVTTVLVSLASVRFGRKPMAISSGIGMLLGLVGIILCDVFQTSGGKYNWLPIVFLFVFIFAGTLGFLTLPFAMVGEMYPQKSRAFASGITMCLAFVISFGHVKMFTTLFDYFGNVAVFSFYSVVTFVGILFAIFILPETKGKSLQEIEQYFKKK